MGRHLRAIFLVVFAVALPVLSAAAPQAKKPSPEDDPALQALIEKVQAVQEKIQTLRVEFTQTNEFEMLSEPQVFEVAPLEDAVARGATCADEFIARYNGRWQNSVEPLFSEFAF